MQGSAVGRWCVKGGSHGFGKTVTIRRCERSRKPSWESIQPLISNGNCILDKVGT